MRGLGAGKRNYIRPVVSVLMPSLSHNSSERIFNRWTWSFDNLFLWFLLFQFRTGSVSSIGYQHNYGGDGCSQTQDWREGHVFHPASFCTHSPSTNCCQAHGPHRPLRQTWWQSNLTTLPSLQIHWAILGGQSSHAQSFLMKWAYFRVL